MTSKVQAGLEENYPNHFRIPGAPIVTERPTRGTRHVPNYSPYGSYDLGAPQERDPP